MQKLSNNQQQASGQRPSLTNRALPPQYGIIWIFIIVIGLILPLLLIPIIAVSGHTEIVEEVAKALVVLFLILKLQSTRTRLFAGAVFGLLFGLSESMFYLNNIFQFGDFSVFWQRLLWTVPMHIVTVLLIVFAGAIRKRFIVLGFLSAVATHILFNSWILTTTG